MRILILKIADFLFKKNDQNSYGKKLSLIGKNEYRMKKKGQAIKRDIEMKGDKKNNGEKNKYRMKNKSI